MASNAEDLLPQGIKDLASVIGLPDALRLMTQLGGLELYMPKSRNSRVWDTLAEVIGEEAADRMVARYADTRLNIPRGVVAARAARNARLRAAYDGGTPVDTLALEYHLTVRHVREILNAPDEMPAGQIGLF